MLWPNDRHSIGRNDTHRAHGRPPYSETTMFKTLAVALVAGGLFAAPALASSSHASIDPAAKTHAKHVSAKKHVKNTKQMKHVNHVKHHAKRARDNTKHPANRSG